MWDEYVFWIDSKKQSAVISDYRTAGDVSEITDKDGRGYGIKSYLYEKINAIENWNAANGKSKRFDTVCGIDLIRKNIHVTFRPRRSGDNNFSFYVNQRRAADLLHQETVVYNLDTKRWKRFAHFTPEAYGKVRGNATGLEFVTMAAGKPYRHNDGNSSFLNFYGIQCEPVISCVYNKTPETVKIFQSLSMDMNNSKIFVDLIYTTQVYGFSYIPANLVKEKEKVFYAAFLRDMVSYLSNPKANDYRSTLQDGKRIFGEYVVMRFIQEYSTLGRYFEFNGVNILTTLSAPTKP